MTLPPDDLKNLAAHLMPGESEFATDPLPQDCILNEFQKKFLVNYFAKGLTRMAVYGGLGCGKSTLLVYLAKLVAETHPGARVLFVMRRYTDLERVARRNLETILGSTWRWYDKRRTWVHLKLRSEIELRHHDIPATSHEGDNPIEGGDVLLVIIDEAQQWGTSQVALHAQHRARQKVADLNGRYSQPGVIINGRPSLVAWWPSYIENALAKSPKFKGAVMRPKTEDNIQNLGEGYIEGIYATHTKEQADALTQGKPYPVEDRVYYNWKDELWPRGNLVRGFKPDPGRPVTVSIDFGYRYPAVLFSQNRQMMLDDGRLVSVEVIFDELAPDRCELGPLMELILAKAWPRIYKDDAPEGAILFDQVIVDPAGNATNPQTGKTSLDIVARPPYRHPDGLGRGLGYAPIIETSPALTSIYTGVEMVLRVICTSDGVRRFACAEDLWNAGLEAGEGHRTFARSMLQYRWPEKRRRLKEGPSKGGPNQPDHHADAWRYMVRSLMADIEQLLPWTPPRESISTGLEGWTDEER